MSAKKPATEAPADAYSVPEFCSRHRISPAFFYKLQARGEGPEIMRAGARVLVTRESAARWRADRTEANHT
jgi:hypothetical protein